MVILIDAYAESGGVSGRKSDSRQFTDFIVDSNFIDASDSLLKVNRERVLQNFESGFAGYRPAARNDPFRCDSVINPAGGFQVCCQSRARR